MRPVPGRLQFKTAPSGAWIVDDSYNANPSSMKAGIEVLAAVDALNTLVSTRLRVRRYWQSDVFYSNTWSLVRRFGCW